MTKADKYILADIEKRITNELREMENRLIKQILRIELENKSFKGGSLWQRIKNLRIRT